MHYGLNTNIIIHNDTFVFIHAITHIFFLILYTNVTTHILVHLYRLVVSIWVRVTFLRIRYLCFMFCVYTGSDPGGVGGGGAYSPLSFAGYFFPELYFCSCPFPLHGGGFHIPPPPSPPSRNVWIRPWYICVYLWLHVPVKRHSHISSHMHTHALTHESMSVYSSMCKVTTVRVKTE